MTAVERGGCFGITVTIESPLGETRNWALCTPLYSETSLWICHFRCAPGFQEGEGRPSDRHGPTHVTANNYAKAYADALIVGTPNDQLTGSRKTKAVPGISHEEIVRMGKGDGGT